MRLVIATGNRGKLAEFERLLAPLGIDCVAQGALGVDEPEETGLSFVENALLKARHAARATGLPALADDSGLCVDALGGAPGLYSARYAGEPTDPTANIRKLLEALSGLPAGQRGARFHASIALLRHADDPEPLIAEGRWAAGPAASCTNRGATAASATTRSSSTRPRAGRPRSSIRRPRRAPVIAVARSRR